MELKIAGGCGEHGRNCFFVDAGETAFLVDCGIMAGSDEPFPRLTADEIRRVKYVFLTHSHADHTGALPWLFENGFCGKIIAARCTLEQLPFLLKNTISLEQICPKNIGEIDGINIEYGRAGHCIGSVWYHFRAGENSAVFSGDYTENSAVYFCDKIRGKSADFAVLDCAYGNDERNIKQCCDEIISEVGELKKRHGTLFFPVPKFGRGIELLKLLRESFPEYICCGDEHFLEQLGAVRLTVCVKSAQAFLTRTNSSRCHAQSASPQPAFFRVFPHRREFSPAEYPPLPLPYDNRPRPSL